jgi:polyhydroxybutyrate depolymerase
MSMVRVAALSVAFLSVAFALVACSSTPPAAELPLDATASPDAPIAVADAGVDAITARVPRESVSLMVDGRLRTFTVVLPANDPGGPLPIILALHGGGGSAEQFERSSKLTPKASAAGFAVVYADGVKADRGLRQQTWNAGGCCDYARDQNIDDVKFFRTVIDHVVSKRIADPKRVFATGHSNGAMMSYRLGCELSDKIAAIAPNAGTMVFPSCAPARPLSVLHMHAKSDANVPIGGGTGTGPGMPTVPPLDDVLLQWAGFSMCNVSPSLMNGVNYTKRAWSGCRAGNAVEAYVTDDGGHAWPGGDPGSAFGDTPSTAIDANDLVVAFFRQHPMP